MTDVLLNKESSIYPLNKYAMPPSEIAKEWIRILKADTDPEVLGTTTVLNTSDKRLSYHNLMRRLHPDLLGKNVGDFVETSNRVISRVNAAYENLR